MNYLAHAYLSFNDSFLLTGNMISDFVKGKKKFEYPLAIQKGIALHRAIDEFTDFHPVISKAKELFREEYRLYSAPLVDIVFDHFLAVDTEQFSEHNALKLFAEKTYQQLLENTFHFPESFQRIFPYMRSQDWLYGYSFKEGIRKSLAGLVRRANYMYESETAFQIFEENYQKLQEYYEAFFPQLKEFASLKVRQLQAE
ncbi:MAG: ACP phosphodiesterase [Ginsengibacter sp.]|jgi:acyl carrier protein phosphodiesterase